MLPVKELLEDLCTLISDYAYVYRFDPNGQPVFEWGSASFFRTTGFTLEDLRQNPFPHMHPEDAEQWRSMAERLFTGEPVEGETRGVNKNGDIRWVHFHNRPIWDASRDCVVRVIGAARDITGERREAAERQRVEALLRGIADNSAVVMYAKDMQGRYILVNTAFQQLYGISHADAIGRTDIDLFGRLEAENYRKNDLEAIQAGGPIAREEIGALDHGAQIFISVKFPLRHPDGDLFAVAGLSTDITRLKKAEAELLQRDREIRQAYADVIAAVTGNKLILMTPKEIEAVLGEPVTPKYVIADASELSNTRELVRKSAPARFQHHDKFNGVVIAFGEALTNAIKHARGGSWWLCETGEALQMVVRDSGPGIDFKMLPKATLLAGFSTAGTLGMGFTIMLDAAERLLLASEPGRTIVVIESQVTPSRTGPVRG